MKKLHLLFVGLFCVFYLQTDAQIDSTFTSELQTIIDEEIIDYGIEGIEVSLIMPDGCSWTGISGIRAPGQAVSLDRKWTFASNTKIFTAAIVLMLHEEDSLSIYDPLYEYLDISMFPTADSSITIKQLLNHTTELASSWHEDPDSQLWTDVWADTEYIWDIDSVLDPIYWNELVPNPTMEHRYIGMNNYLILGYLIEAITQTDLQSAFDNYLFDPLGMENSYLGIDGIDMTDINGVYNGSYYKGNLPHNSYMSTRGAGGNLISSTYDVAVFTRAFIQDELVSSELMEEARTNTAGDPAQVPENCLGGVNQYYGYGIVNFEFGDPNGSDIEYFYGHAGNGLGNVFSFHSIEHNFTLVLSINDYSMQYEAYLIYMSLVCHIIDNIDSECVDVTSVQEIEKNTFSLYPNPGTDQINIQLNKNAKRVSLFNNAGILIQQYNQVGTFLEINSEELAKGMYFIEIEMKDAIQVEKWIKE